MSNPDHNPGYLCYAWGETDFPVFRFVNTPEEVGQFFCDEWFGQQPEAMVEENRECYDHAMQRVRSDRLDPDGWDGTDEISFEFEIGGISIKRCFQSAPTEAAAMAATVPAPEHGLPLGAIVNGKTCIDRLERDYAFQCEGGPLAMCADWDMLKRCFFHLAEHAKEIAQRDPDPSVGWPGAKAPVADQPAEPFPALMSWDQAQRVAYQAAAAFRPPYFDGPGFQAHEWVVEAVRSAHLDGQLFANGKPPLDRSSWTLRSRTREGAAPKGDSNG